MITEKSKTRFLGYKSWFLIFLKISKNRTENFGFFYEHHRFFKILK
jgi:hypothetical protein